MILLRTVGVKYWVCPSCAHQNRSQCNPPISGWLLQCTNAKCQHRFVAGEILYPVMRGPKTVPIDLLPADTIVNSAPWRSGHPVNQATCVSCGVIVRQSLRDWMPADAEPIAQPVIDDTTEST